jgi:hypothetical protein
MAFYRKLRAAASNIGLSSADPCLFYKWEGGRVVIMISWIDDNMIVGPSDMVMKLKSYLTKEFECDTAVSSMSTSGTRSNTLVRMPSVLFRLSWCKALRMSSTLETDATTRQHSPEQF